MGGRIKGLDAIRGIAAALVVVYHVMQLSLWPTQFYGATKVLLLKAFVLNGRFAVITFFVLSGFVLAMSMDKPFVVSRADVAKFYIRRVCRLYLPYLAGLLFAALLLFAVTGNGFAELRQNEWSLPTQPKNIISLLTMFGIVGDLKLNGPVWTLFVEMQVSPLIPLLFLVVPAKRKWVLMVATVFSIACGTLMVSQGNEDWIASSTFANRLLLTGYYVQFFAYGALLYFYRSEVSVAIRKLSTWAVVAGFVCAIGLLGTLFIPIKPISDFCYGLSALWVIACCYSVPEINRFLSQGPMAYLGKISFSLYLVHMPIIFALMVLIEPLYGKFAAGLASVVVAFFVGHLFNLIVEQPAIRLGKALTSRKSPSAY
jgi:peptidoglycan/LPS O-acetylase OafA/YrhL